MIRPRVRDRFLRRNGRRECGEGREVLSSLVELGRLPSSVLRPSKNPGTILANLECSNKTVKKGRGGLTSKKVCLRSRRSRRKGETRSATYRSGLELVVFSSFPRPREAREASSRPLVNNAITQVRRLTRSCLREPPSGRLGPACPGSSLLRSTEQHCREQGRYPASSEHGRKPSFLR